MTMQKSSRMRYQQKKDKSVLLELKQALVAAKNMANLVRTFGDEDMKEKLLRLR